MKDLPSPNRPILINGKHSVVVEDDLISIRFIGTYEPEDARALLVLLESLQQQRPAQFLLIDLGQASKPPGPETRRVVAEWASAAQVYAAYFGGNGIMKAIGILTQSAMRLVGKQQMYVHFADSEAQARAWLAKQREILVASG